MGLHLRQHHQKCRYLRWQPDAIPRILVTLISFGKKWRYDEQYAYPEVVARELQLDGILVEQPIGPNHGWNLIRSRVTYYQEYVAAAQAQQLWDRSRIVQQHQAGKVVRARYGFEEIETGYHTWLGGCEDPDRPWLPSPSRDEYLVKQAFRLTLIHALDVEGYRAYSGLTQDDFSDEDLLTILHRRRAESRHIPDAVRAESDQWLREHDQSKTKSK
jgi:hypothetical protein